MADSENQFL